MILVGGQSSILALCCMVQFSGTIFSGVQQTPNMATCSWSAIYAKQDMVVMYTLCVIVV